VPTVCAIMSPRPAAQAEALGDDRLQGAWMTVDIDVFRPEHASRFAELNRRWLEEYHLMEPAEEGQLADPQKHFIECGGQIFVALHNGQVVGTCAVLPHGEEALELAKLTIASEFRGQGLARRLVERCIAHARERCVRRIVLVSNSQLHSALRLYESLGFSYCAVPETSKYKVADVCMILNLESTSTSRR
jgi:ribosomal protein S18 acetylase RimI-like enzyme